MSNYLAGTYTLPPGSSPLVVTFDDSNPDQIKFTPDGHVDKKCFIGIWQEFTASHPDFPVVATFFVLPDVMWGQPKFRQAKLKYLLSLGCEIGNHTMTHPILKKLSDEKVKYEIGEAELKLKTLGLPTPACLALPFGVSPKNRSLLNGFDYKGVHIQPKAVFLVGAEPALNVRSPKFNRLRIPRIQACEGPSGLTYWLDRLEKK